MSYLSHQGDVVPFLDGTVSDLLSSMDRSGIDLSVVCSVATGANQAGPILEWSHSIAGDRIIPFPSVVPLSESAIDDLSGIAGGGFRGVKLHPEYQDFHIDDPALSDFYGLAEKEKLVILFHAGYDIGFPDSDRSAPARIAAVRTSFPRLRIVASHLGGFRQWEEALKELAGTDVYLDTSYVFGHIPDGLLAEILDAHRPDRILFGSDSPWAGQPETLLQIRGLDLDPMREKALLGGNAAELLRL
jgi:predicted TIM-barrel fold metal-dependent hydrolase